MSTIRQVAIRAGVSSTTVSHVLNKTRFVSEETRRRVLEACSELGYQPNALARSLRRGETRTLGLILPDSANPFFAEIGRAIEEAAFDENYSVILCNTEGDAAVEELYISVLVQKQVDGIIFVSSGEKTAAFQALLNGDIPAVLVDRDMPELEVDAVLVDNQQGGVLAARHLLDLGHRRIACISGPSHLTPSALRYIGFLETIQEAGILLEPELVLNGDFHPTSGYRATLELLKRPEPPTAIFVCNDLMAIGVLNAAEELGCRVPVDLAVVGFDDIELASFTVPPLTTLAQPKKEIGQKAIDLLVGRIHDRDLPVQRTLLPMTLIIRKSTGVYS